MSLHECRYDARLEIKFTHIIYGIIILYILYKMIYIYYHVVLVLSTEMSGMYSSPVYVSVSTWKL